jgi:RNA polymerase primary sigma factor
MISLLQPPKPAQQSLPPPIPDKPIEFVGLKPGPAVERPDELAAALDLARHGRRRARKRTSRDGDSRLSTVDRLPADTHPANADFRETDLLTPAEEQELFRAMNLLKAAAERKRAASQGSSVRVAREVAQLLAAALRIRNEIIAANARLVVAVAKKFDGSRCDRSELVSEGNFTLIRAVEKFDFSRGFRFSTYATWALRYHFQRLAKRAGDRLNSRQAGHDATATIAAPEAPDPADLANRRRWVGQLDRILAKLDPREQEVVRARYGLAGGETSSLNEVARRLGVCKERIRQLQLRALTKLKALADAHRIVSPFSE